MLVNAPSFREGGGSLPGPTSSSLASFAGLLTFLCTWLLLGMFMYKAANDFTWSNAFYFSVQSGLGIGFGALQEHSRWSRLYACFHMLTGGLFISIVLNMFVERLLISLVQVSKQTATFKMVTAMTALVAWLGAGTLMFAMQFNNADSTTWTWIDSLEFSVSAITTTGLSGPPVNTISGHISDEIALSVSFFALIGVSVYCYAIQQLTHYVVVAWNKIQVVQPLQSF